MHSIKQCCTLKKEAGKHKKGRENGNHKNTKRRYNPSKEEIHALAAFSKEAMVKEYENGNKELANFEIMPMPGNEADEQKTGPGLAKKFECFMANHDVNLATKSKKIKFESLDECLITCIPCILT